MSTTTGPESTPGASAPLGATVGRGGVNFSVFSRHASGIELLFFDGPDDARPTRVVRLDPVVNRTYHYWHALVPGVQAGQLYGYRVEGPFDPTRGMRFDPAKVLLDPYGRGVAVPTRYSRETARKPGDNAATAMKSVVVDPRAYDWEGDAPLRRPASQTIVYEMHVRGFTRHPTSGVADKTRGTYAGLLEKIPYLKDLGVTALELLPVFQFDTQDAAPGLVNYWGYAPVSFFAPHQAYSSRQDPLGAVDEFRDMVHRFVSLLNARRVLRDVRYEHQRLSLAQMIQAANKAWHGVRLHQPDWGHSSHSLALTLELKAERRLAHFLLNAYWEPLEFELPPVGSGRPDPWRRWIDTALDSPHDIVPWRTAPSTPGALYRTEARSVVVLFADLG